ncbi:MAG: pseudouridine synthase [Pseudobdellovibrionaceae bacterium]
MTENKNPRLSKLMSERGICSRREADGYIQKGLVLVNGIVVKELGTRVDPSASITLAAQAMKAQKDLVTILLNKPVGYVSAQPEPPYEPAVRLITLDSQDPQEKQMRLRPENFDGLACAGRLDIDSQGLLVFTQDGRIAKQLIGEDSHIEKEYLVRVRGDLSDEGLELLNFGLKLDGEALKRAKVEWLNDDQLRFILKEGKKRQIRRMCELVGLQVTGLKRVRVGQVRLGKLPEGQWRFLKKDESFS